MVLVFFLVILWGLLSLLILNMTVNNFGLSDHSNSHKSQFDGNALIVIVKLLNTFFQVNDEGRRPEE